MGKTEEEARTAKAQTDAKLRREKTRQMPHTSASCDETVSYLYQPEENS